MCLCVRWKSLSLIDMLRASKHLLDHLLERWISEFIDRFWRTKVSCLSWFCKLCWLKKSYIGCSWKILLLLHWFSPKLIVIFKWFIKIIFLTGWLIFQLMSKIYHKSGVLGHLVGRKFDHMLNIETYLSTHRTFNNFHCYLYNKLTKYLCQTMIVLAAFLHP